MTPQARNRRKGAEWELAVLKGLRARGFKAERLRLTGRNDEGDIAVYDQGEDLYDLLELKDWEKWAPAQWVREAEVEAENFAKHRGLDVRSVNPIVVVKRRGKNWTEAYVLTTLKDYLDL